MIIYSSELFAFVQSQVTQGHPISNDTKGIPRTAGRRYTLCPKFDCTKTLVTQRNLKSKQHIRIYRRFGHFERECYVLCGGDRLFSSLQSAFFLNSVTCLSYGPFLGAFAKLREATICFVMSVCPSARNISAPTGRDLIKFGI